MFDRINLLLAKVHEGLMSWVPPYLGEMRDVLDLWFRQFGLPEISLPLATCQAVGGDPNSPSVLHTSSAMLAGIVGTQILEDIRLKQDSEALWLKIGTERAVNFALAFQTLSSRLWGKLLLEGDATHTMHENFQEAIMVLLASHNHPFQPGSWENYWKHAEMSSAFLPSKIALIGAMGAGTQNEKIITACHDFGFHLGLVRHILNELINMKVGLKHLGNGSMNLPILYALKTEHQYKAELIEITRNGQLSLHQNRVREILESVEAKKYLMWAALQERSKALQALETCPDEKGKKFLQAFIQEWFDRIPEFSSGNEIKLTNDNIPERSKIFFNPFEASNGHASLAYKSIGLGLRKQIRQSPLYQNTQPS